MLEAHGQLRELWPEVLRSSYPEYAGSFVEAVPQASLLREYHPLLVPGLLQTQDYAYALIKACNPMETDDFFLDLVQKRIERQEMIRESETPVIWAIIIQSVIRDLERDPEILAGQVDHLIDLMDQGRVLLQVVPAAVRFRDHPGLDGAFSLVSLPDQQEVVYVEGPVSGSMVTDPGMVERMSLKFGGLQSVALPRMKHESSSRRFEKRSMDTRNWHKSSYSNGDGGNCVEAYEAPQTVKVRDTQHRHLGHLTFTTTEWSTLLHELKTAQR